MRQQIGPGSVQLDVSVNETTKLETVTLGLFVHLQREHFTRGKAKVSLLNASSKSKYFHLKTSGWN